MAVQFILGRSGTGKTRYCVNAIIDALLEQSGQSLILLVPEQASYQAERAVLSDSRIDGYNKLSVVSFSRLEFSLVGGHTGRPELSRIARQMIIQRILRASDKELKVFGPSANWPGLGRQMAETISELHQYARKPEDISRLLAELKKDGRNSLSALKFSDIGLILEQYLEAIEGKFTDPDIQLGRACRAVAEADFIKGAKLWVDGFAGFTAGELTMLTELSKTVADAHIALCLDPSRIDLVNPDIAKPEHFGLFGPTEQTYAALLEIVGHCRLKLDKPIVLDSPVRFSRCRQLAHIERNVFEDKAPGMRAADSVRIVSASNARAEARFVARQILRLVKEKGYRYRDIAVIASDIESYEHYIKAYFDDYGIEFFLDKRRALNQHPLDHLICSALQVVVGGFCHHDIFSYLKTDLVPGERCDVDLLENYCVAFGISPADWQSGKEWQFAGEKDKDFDELRINHIRRELSRPLLELKAKLCAGDGPAKISAVEFRQAISEFLDSLGIREKIAEWIEAAREANDHAKVDEHRQFYEKMLNVFDELVEVFGAESMTAEDYYAIIGSAFSQLTLALIPPTLDQVLVGSIERSRHPDLKAVFLIGATQRQFPVPVSLGGILTDDDRRAAEAAQFGLAATARQKLAQRQYLAYIAFTRPSEFLCVTYPLMDDKGSPQCRSQFIANLESLFDDLKEESVGDEQVDVDQINSKSDLADLLCSRLGKDVSRDSSPVTRDAVRDTERPLVELLEALRADEQFEEVGSRVASAINYENRAQLEKGVVTELFGSEVRSSATRLGTFAKCPYQYFARYVLELRERRECKFEPLDLGSFYHRVLDGLLKRLNAEKKDFATIDDEYLLRLLREQITELTQKDSFISNFSRHRRHNAYIISSAGEVLEDCVRAIAQMVRAGNFRPSRSEVAFGEVKDAVDRLGEYKMKLSDGRALFLNGKIDRIDIGRTDDKEIAVVFDYKRKATPFSWQGFYHGLDMQLPIYMLAVRSANDIAADVVGGFYMPVEVNLKKSTLDELSPQTEGSDYKAKGIFNGEFHQQLDSARDRGWSQFYSFRMAAKEKQYGNYGTSSALRPNDFEAVLRFAERRMVELAEKIVSGRIDVQPYRLSGKSPCGNCDYKSVCRFDWQVNNYNTLESVSKGAVIGKMGVR